MEKAQSDKEMKTEVFPAAPATMQQGVNISPFATAYGAFAQITTYQKEPNPEVEKYRIEGLNKLTNALHEQEMKRIELQEKQMDKLAEIQKINDTREFRMTQWTFLIITAVVGVSIALLFLKRTAEGLGLLSGGLGIVLGYLAGYGQGLRKRTF
jgi:hypothetical protein